MHDALPIAGFTQPTNEISLIYVHICLHNEPKVPFEYECKQLVLHTHRLWLRVTNSGVQTNL